MPKEETFPIPPKFIDVIRSAHTDLDVMQEKRVDDYWNVDLNRCLSDSWKGSRSLLYYSARNQFERFRGFLELISRFEFEFCRCVNYFFERFEFLVCSCECAVACLCPRNSISNVVASVTIDDNIYIYM